MYVETNSQAGNSWWNAYVTGKCWAESKAVGGWMHVVTWSGAIMSALGFSSVYVFGLGYGLYAFGQINDQMVQLVLSMWYVLAIVPILGAGLIMTMESWRQFYRDRSLMSLGVSSWNTYAQIHNTMSALESVGDCMGFIGKTISAIMSGDNDDANTTIGKLGLVLCILVVAVALLGGALHTTILVKKYAATDPMPERLPGRQSARA